MDSERANEIINGYTKWLRDGIDVYQNGDAVSIVYPMLDRHNDHMSICLADDSSTGGYIMSDLGNTLSDLALYGCDVLGSESRIAKLESTLSGYGVSRSDGELFVRADQRTLNAKMNMLVQCMATVDDLFFTVKDSVRSYFIDDVHKWFNDNNIRVFSNFKITGTTGFDVRFDFVIPETLGKAPDRFIKTVNNPVESAVKNALFGWADVKSARAEKSELYVFLNRMNTPSGEIESGIIDACKNWEVNPVVWDKGVEKDVMKALVA